MKARELIALAEPHGPDFVHAAQTATVTTKPSDTRTVQRGGMRMQSLKDPHKDVTDSSWTGRAHGTPTRSMRKPKWTVAELGQASKDVPDIAFRAACYSYAGQEQHFWRLHRELRNYAMRLQNLNNWPPQVSGADGQPRFYLENLVSLVLHEDQHPAMFAALEDQREASARVSGQPQGPHARYMGITEHLWRASMSHRFAEVQLKWLEWLDLATRHMNRRLRDDEDGEGEE